MNETKGLEVIENCPLTEPFFSEKAWVSPLNYAPEIQKQLTLPKKIIIHDVTLRDGEQTAGVAFTEDEKVFLAQELDAIGIPLIELGFGAIEKDRRAFKRLSAMKLNAKILACTRIMEEDVKRAIDSGADGLFLETALNPYLVRHVFKYETTEAFIDQCVKCANMALDAGLFVEFCAWDTFRVNNLDYIKRVYTEVTKRAKVDQIGISDTFGQAHPLTMQFLVRKMKEWVPNVPLSLHGHNDFGMTTANALMALTSGAEAIECAFNGLGERAGNMATEEVIAAVELLFGIKTGVDLKQLYRISKFVAEISKVPVAKTKPIVGGGIFESESGIVIDIMIKLQALLGIPYTMYPYSPEVFSRQMKFVGGVGSGKAFVRDALKKMHIEVPDEKIPLLVEKVKELGAILKNAIPEEELETLARRVMEK